MCFPLKGSCAAAIHQQVELQHGRSIQGESKMNHTDFAHQGSEPKVRKHGQSQESPLEGAGTQGEKMNDLCSGSVQSGRGRMQRKRTRARDRLQEITAVSPKSNIKATTGLTGAADQMEHRSEVRIEVCIPRSFTAGGNGPDQAKLNSLKLAKVSGRSRYSI